MDWLLGLALVLIAFVAAIAGLLTVQAVQGPSRQVGASIFSAAAQGGEGTVFLFDGDTLIDATPAARQILATSRGRGSHWLRLIGYLSLYFPDVEAQVQRLEDEGQILLEGRSSQGKTLLLAADLSGGLIRISLTDPTQDGRPMLTDALAHRALTQEVEHLREALAQAPLPIWRETEGGEVVWANSALSLIHI